MLRVAALLVAVALAALPGCLSASQLRTALDPTSYAREVLSSDPYAKLVVEIDHPPTSPPAKNALDHLERTLREVTSKENIEIRLEASLESTPEARWTVPEIHRLAEASRTHEHGSPDAVIHVLYLEGEYAEGAAGGLGVYAGWAVVFPDAFRGPEPSPLGLPSPLSPAARVEAAVLLHEVGHVMGLVNFGIPMVRPHEDPEHPGHSDNPGSVMYWTTDQVSTILENLRRGDTGPSTFDENDRADLRSVGGR